MADNTQHAFMENRAVKFLLLDAFLQGQQLVRRFNNVDDFRFYVQDRMALIAVAGVVLISIGIGCSMGVVASLSAIPPMLVLPMILLLPIVFVGSLLACAIIFFSWIEGRSMERMLGKRSNAKRGTIATWLESKSGIDIGPAPRVPWTFFILFLLAPLGLLAYDSFASALIVIALAITLPVLYAKFD